MVLPTLVRVAMHETLKFQGEGMTCTPLLNRHLMGATGLEDAIGLRAMQPWDSWKHTKDNGKSIDDALWSAKRMPMLGDAMRRTLVAFRERGGECRGLAIVGFAHLTDSEQTGFGRFSCALIPNPLEIGIR